MMMSLMESRFEEEAMVLIDKKDAVKMFEKIKSDLEDMYSRRIAVHVLVEMVEKECLLFFMKDEDSLNDR